MRRRSTASLFISIAGSPAAAYFASVIVRVAWKSPARIV
jgi:hypothetical protein